MFKNRIANCYIRLGDTANHKNSYPEALSEFNSALELLN